MARTRSKAERKGARRRRARGRRGAWVVRAALGALGGLLLLLLFGLGYLMMSYPNQPGPGRGHVSSVVLARGGTLEQAAERLAEVGALRDRRLFAWYARVLGAGAHLREGEILVYDNMSPRDLLRRVARGYGSSALRIVVPEGFSRFDIAQRLSRFGVCSADAFLRATEDPALLRELGIEGPSAEGLLFPDTYVIEDDGDPGAVVRRLVKNARRRLEPVLAEDSAGLAQLKSDLGFGVNEVLTLASIVEKEAAVASEQAVIAGVFLNRLRDPAFSPKRLQADPTVAYGCLVKPALSSCASFDGHIVTHSMVVDADNPYNTYRLDGLPPGPIANPGLSAVRAVLAPAIHDYFYFVAKGGGLHVFSHSLDEHNANVERLRTH